MKCLLLFYGVCVLRALQFKNIKNAQAFLQITHQQDSQWALTTNHSSCIVFKQRAKILFLLPVAFFLGFFGLFFFFTFSACYLTLVPINYFFFFCLISFCTGHQITHKGNIKMCFRFFSPTLTFLSSSFTFLNRHFYILVFLWCNLKATEVFFFFISHTPTRNHVTTKKQGSMWRNDEFFFFFFLAVYALQ